MKLLHATGRWHSCDRRGCGHLCLGIFHRRQRWDQRAHRRQRHWITQFGCRDGSPFVAGSGNFTTLPVRSPCLYPYAGFVNNPTMEIAGLGTEFDASSFYLNTIGAPVFPTVDVVSGGEGFWAFNTYSLSWDYQGKPAIFFNFGTSGPARFADRLTIGTFGEAIPRPPLALLGLAGLGRRRRS